MRLVILCRDETLHAVRRIADEAKRRRHRVRIMDPYCFLLKVEGGELGLEYKGKPFTGADVFMPRLGAAISDHSLALVRHLGAAGRLVINRAGALEIARDKLAAAQLLAQSGLPVPRTAFAPDPEALPRALAAVGGPPAVIKLPRSAQGRGVMMAETEGAARSIVEAMWALDRSVIVQEFIPEARGSDLRVLVIGGKAAGAVRRTAPKGEFRSNLHRGGSVRRARLTKKMTELAERAVNICGLDIAGVDILEAKGGLLVLEVNAAPGIEGFDRTGGGNIVSRIVDFIEEHRAEFRSGGS
jgi:ribosomal protein S6--L-glutamate ligase